MGLLEESKYTTADQYIYHKGHSNMLNGQKYYGYRV